MDTVCIVAVVENEEVRSAVCRALLKNTNLKVHIMNDVFAALQFAGERHPDLILIDREVIQKEGLGLLLQMRRVSSAPLLALSRADRNRQISGNHAQKNSLVAQVGTALARAGVQAVPFSVIL